ncbi:glycosyltransferase family 2 protein [Halomarina oriensis]|uniref:Glycosyltransferase n=1 Tax=Halomarina oriensis TaxID=671145 RepID=A0A6B0GF76_9EURY|nr:glycosyltransferase family 2 protein [Halomarina oriensis]MWG33160.1 glycosyltransferase [Halomarina oriensis]
MSDPLVSVVVPTHNRADTVGGAIETALDQTYDPLEVVVVDDGSTDATPERLADYADDPRVRTVRNDSSRGVAGARNRGLALADGEFVCALDDDDRWHPEKVARQVARLRELGEEYCGVYCGERVVVEGEDHERERVVTDGYEGDHLPNVLVRMDVLPHSGHLVRAWCLDAVGGYDERFDIACDWALAIELARRWQWGYVAAPLVERHRHGENLSSSAAYDVRARELVAEHFGDVVDEVGVRRPFEAAAARERGLLAVENGDRRTARRELLTALRHVPSPAHAALVCASLGGRRALAGARAARSLGTRIAVCTE